MIGMIGSVRPALAAVIDTWLGGLLLLWQVLTARGRFKGAYWTWRWEPAFGAGAPPKGELRAGLLHYARWVGAMSRL